MLVDVLIGILLLGLAAGTLYAENLFGSLSLFVAFGMLMALAWARLNAPDLALAEAAIGAGLSGALLFNALQKNRPDPERRDTRRHRISASLLCLVIFALLLHALLPAVHSPSEIPALVERHLPASGVDYSVTAVLLNFRAWDTLLEIAVLLLAVLGFKSLRTTHTETPSPWPVLVALGKTLAPFAVVTSGYLLWRGAGGPGGAFQAGSLLAAAAVMLRLGHVLPPLRWSRASVRLATLVGPVIFLATAAATMWLGDGWLSYPASWAKVLTLLIETTATVSIAMALTLLVVADGDELQS